jgi:hypothetical protein
MDELRLHGRHFTPSIPAEYFDSASGRLLAGLPNEGKSSAYHGGRRGRIGRAKRRKLALIAEDAEDAEERQEKKAIECKQLPLANVPAKSKLAAAGHEKSPRF